MADRRKKAAAAAEARQPVGARETEQQQQGPQQSARETSGKAEKQPKPYSPTELTSGDTEHAVSAAGMSDAAWPWMVFLAATGLKLALIPAYRSTDFEVHRNWLAVTHSLPWTQWYFEDTSQWTLDYPPLFAWFEFALSHVARLFDPGMLHIQREPYETAATVLFQRLSVMVTDLVLLWAVLKLSNSTRLGSWYAESAAQQTRVLAALLLLNFGLFIVDHIHFQYNGLLFGIMLLSIAYMLQGECLKSGLAFAVLLNFKHIYLYIAPVYFVYLLRVYCLHNGRVQVLRFLALAAVVGGVFAASLGPFIVQGQGAQLFQRLFPFKRGLCHAFWAPNFWALYNVADKVLGAAGARLGYVQATPTASMTGGLVAEQAHVVLPSVPPLATLVLTVLAMLPALARIWQRRTREDFLRGLVICAFASFAFGWHVHEKAILIATLPFSLLAVRSAPDARQFMLLCVSGHYALLPLIFPDREYFIKIAMFAAFTLGSWAGLHSIVPFRFSFLERAYLLGFVPLELLTSFVLPRVLAHLPFLPLLLVSLYSSLGVLAVFVAFYVRFWRESTSA